MAKNREMVDANAMMVQVTKDGEILLRVELADLIEWQCLSRLPFD